MLEPRFGRGYLGSVTQTDRVTSRTALVLALIGLMASLGGASYAAVKINGNQIQKGTITARQVKDGGLLAADFKAGELTPGPRGVQGPQGEVGPAGPGAKLVTLGVSPTETSTELVSGLSISWECNPGTDAILQAVVTSGQAEWTGTVWNNGSPGGQSVAQSGLVIGSLEAASQRGFTGTIRSTATGKVVWVDALFKMDGASCTGRVVSTPLT